MGARAIAGPSGPELVLVHGWGMNAAVWDGWLPGLAARGRVRTVELPGHGAAAFDPRRSRLSDWAETCLASAPARAFWLGWSLGGLVALQAALLAPQRIAGLVLLAATPRFVQAPDWPWAMAAETLHSFHDQLARDHRATLERFLALQARAGDQARTTLRTLRQRLAAKPLPQPAALSIGLDLLAGSDLRGQLGQIRCPMLWLFGNRDTLVPGAVGQALAGLLPSARVRVVAGAAHAPFLSHPEPTLAEVGQVLDVWTAAT